MTEQETRETPADGADTSRTSEGQTGQGNTSPTDALPAGEGPVARRSAHEEFAAEMTPRAEAGAAYPIEERREETGFGLGALALALSVLSLFFAPSFWELAAFCWVTSPTTKEAEAWELGRWGSASSRLSSPFSSAP